MSDLISICNFQNFILFNTWHINQYLWQSLDEYWVHTLSSVTSEKPSRVEMLEIKISCNLIIYITLFLTLLHLLDFLNYNSWCQSQARHTWKHQVVENIFIELDKILFWNLLSHHMHYIPFRELQLNRCWYF